MLAISRAATSRVTFDRSSRKASSKRCTAIRLPFSWFCLFSAESREADVKRTVVQWTSADSTELHGGEMRAENSLQARLIEEVHVSALEQMPRNQALTRTQWNGTAIRDSDDNPFRRDTCDIFYGCFVI